MSNETQPNSTEIRPISRFRRSGLIATGTLILTSAVSEGYALDQAIDGNYDTALGASICSVLTVGLGIAVGLRELRLERDRKTLLETQNAYNRRMALIGAVHYRLAERQEIIDTLKDEVDPSE